MSNKLIDRFLEDFKDMSKEEQLEIIQKIKAEINREVISENEAESNLWIFGLMR